MPKGSRRPKVGGLAGLRRDSTLGDLLFLNDCTAVESARLRPIADRLGVTVQAASHTYRKLARRGLVELRDGRYRPTVPGVEWLHRTLRDLSDDVFVRQQRLSIVRSCRAVAISPVRAGERVTLELVEGVLSARPGRGNGSQGRARTGGPSGTLLDIDELEGILRIPEAEVRVLTLPARELGHPDLVSAIARALSPRPPGLLGARGLEAHQLTRRAVRGSVGQFAMGATATEAARVGVPSTIVVLDEDLPGLLDEFPVAGRPRLTVRSVPLPASGRPRGRPDRSSEHRR